MQGGRLRNRVTLQSRRLLQSPSGEAFEEWSDVAVLPASVAMPGGTERFVNDVDRTVATVTHKVRLRWRADVTPLHRLVVERRVLDIVSVVDPDGRRRELVAMCREVV